MSVESSLRQIEGLLYGKKISSVEASNLVEKLPDGLPLAGFLTFSQNFPLIGVSFSLAEEEDESGLGADLIWLSPEKILDEALNYYPGIAVITTGYLPVGSCLLGSGDPYFLQLIGTDAEDPALVRVPHEFARENESYPIEGIEVVTRSLSDFFRRAKVE